jgi:hypothetical protein
MMGRPRIYTEEELKERRRGRQREYYKTYYHLNKEQYVKTSKKYRQTEKGKAALERARTKERANLSDNYIVQVLACNLYNNGKHRLDRKSVPKEMIEMCRQTISAKREFKLLNN